MISIQAARRRARQPALEPPLDHTTARLLAMLHDRSGALTIATMRERGIQAPAQRIYTLQLAGYEIERCYIGSSAGRRTPAYRLCISSLPLPERSDGTREVRGV